MNKIIKKLAFIYSIFFYLVSFFFVVSGIKEELAIRNIQPSLELAVFITIISYGLFLYFISIDYFNKEE